MGTLAMALVLGVGLVGQAWLDRAARPLAWAPLLLAGAAFGLLARRDALERPYAPAASRAAAPQPWLLGAACILAALAFPGFGGNLFRPLPTAAWLASLALLYGAFRLQEPESLWVVHGRSTHHGARKRPQGARLRCWARRFQSTHRDRRGEVTSPPLRAFGASLGRGCRSHRRGAEDAEVSWADPLRALSAPAVHPRSSSEGSEAMRDDETRAGGIYLSWQALALIAILLAAAFLRLYQLDAIPREMGTDMPLKYQNALEIMRGQFMIFCPRYPGREALFHYLVAGYGAVFGLSYFAIKSTSVMMGLASIVALYGLARELFDRDVGLVAAALLGVSKWHVILSRSGYRASLMPLMIAGALHLLVRAVRRGRASDYVVAGMAVGLGLYTYNAFMLVPVVAAAALAVELARQGRGALRRQGWGLAGFGLGALAVFLPLGRYALEQPQSYLFRVATRVTGAEAPLPQDLLRALAGNLGRAAGMFNLRGDVVSYINVPYQRELGLVSGVLFLCGLAYALLRLRRGHNAMVLIFLGAMLLPTALAVAFPNEVPSAQRAAGAIIPAYLLAALPLTALLRRTGPFFTRGGVQGGRPDRSSETCQVYRPRARQEQPVEPTNPPEPPPGSEPGGSGTRCPAVTRMLRAEGSLSGSLLAVVLVLALLGFELAETSRAYFEQYVRHLPGNNYAISLEMARTLDGFAGQGPGYIKVWPHWYDGNAVRAQLRAVPEGEAWELEALDPARPPLTTAGARLLVIVNPEDVEALQLLRAMFPRGVAVSHVDYAGQVAFIAFYGER